MSAIETILRICKRSEYFCSPLLLLPMKMYMLFVYCLRSCNHVLTNVIENVAHGCKLNAERNVRRVFPGAVPVNIENGICMEMILLAF